VTLATCTVLATVVPVLLLGVALEGRSTRARLRISVFYAITVGVTIVAALALIVMVTVGANRSGIGSDVAPVAWVLFGIVIVGTMLFLTWLVSGYEREARAAERKRVAEEAAEKEAADKEAAAKAAAAQKLTPFDHVLALLTGHLKKK
jgi:Mg2+/citrate symporter